MKKKTEVLSQNDTTILQTLLYKAGTLKHDHKINQRKSSSEYPGSELR